MTLLERHPSYVASVAIVLLLLYWLFEIFWNHGKGKSITRFTTTFIGCLLVTFLSSLLFLKISNSYPTEPDAESIQEARFGECGAFLKTADKITLYSLDPTFLNEKEQLSKRELFHTHV